MVGANDGASAPWFTDVMNKWGDLLPGGGNAPQHALVTRAEFAHVLNSVMEFPPATADFNDVTSATQYADAIGALQAAGVVHGHDGNFNPNSTIRRSDAGTMIARALSLAESNVPLRFTDAAAIPDWAAPYVAALTDFGYIQGFENGEYRPNSLLSRAQIFTIIERVAGQGMVVTAAGTVVEDVTINGNLIIAASVGSGNVTLRNVNLLGTLVVQGGGLSSIIIEGTTVIPRVFVDHNVGAGVRITVQATASVSAVLVNGGSGSVVIAGDVDTVILNAEGVNLDIAAGSNVGYVYVAPTAAGADVVIAGEVNSVEVAAPASSIVVAATALVHGFGVTGSAVGIEITVVGTVESMTIFAADAVVDNQGTIEDFNAPADVVPTGNPPEHTEVVEAGSVNDVYL
jgi:hypothetical protein